MNKHIEVTGDSVAAAIQKGLDCMKLEKEQVDIEVLNEGKSGLFGLVGAIPAKVRITAKENSAGVPAASPSQPSGECALVLPPAAAEAEEALGKIFNLMGFEVKLSSVPSPGGFIINAGTSDGALLIGKNGQTMSALEYILKLIIRKHGNRDIRVVLNIDGYLEKKNEKLTEKAHELAEKVRMKGEPVSVRLPSDERRIIHMALKNESDIETVSEGEGAERKLVIRFKNNSGSGR